VICFISELVSHLQSTEKGTQTIVSQVFTNERTQRTGLQ
jgi:hypothetical protein